MAGDLEDYEKLGALVFKRGDNSKLAGCLNKHDSSLKPLLILINANDGTVT
jgi:hypothetical protein